MWTASWSWTINAVYKKGMSRLYNPPCTCVLCWGSSTTERDISGIDKLTHKAGQVAVNCRHLWQWETGGHWANCSLSWTIPFTVVQLYISSLCDRSFCHCQFSTYTQQTSIYSNLFFIFLICILIISNIAFKHIVWLLLSYCDNAMSRGSKHLSSLLTYC